MVDRDTQPGSDPNIGRNVGNYRLTRLIGEGGMGAVYLAEHPRFQRRMAVKLLQRSLGDNREMVERFLNDGRAANAIRHPNIIDVVDMGVLPETGTPYIVMEYLEGESLGSRIHKQGQLAVKDALDFADQAAAAVGAAHAKQVVHRDLKPDNLFLIADPDRPGRERVKVLDFGIAKLSGDVDPGLVRTQTGAFLGTPQYMSPEQCRGGVVDERSDVYSLGIIVYEMLCGQPPFVSPGFGEVMSMHLNDTPARPRTYNARIPEALERVILRALAKEPDRRFATMAELQDALAGARPAQRRAGATGAADATERSPGRGRTVALAGAAVALALGIVAVAAVRLRAWREPRSAPAPVEPAPRAAPPSASEVPHEVRHEVPHDVRHGVPAAALAKAAPAPPATITITIALASAPVGAKVRDAATGELLGVTPLRLTRPPTAGTLKLLLEARGYRPARIELPADASSERTVRLNALPKPGGHLPI